MAFEYITKAEAEEKSGVKCDGRKKYFIWGGIVCTDEKFSHPCSGCTCDT